MKKPISLRELYEMLGAVVEKHGDLPVVSEGCDCDGDVGDVVLEDGRVYLLRTKT